MPLSLGVNLLSREGNSQDGRMKGKGTKENKGVKNERMRVSFDLFPFLLGRQSSTP